MPKRSSLRSVRAATTATALLSAAALVPATAAAMPADRAAAAAAYAATVADLKVPAGWTGDVQSCTVGTESEASIAATLRTVNRLRDFAGLAPVSFDPARNAKALAAALMMRAANQSSHFPDPAWPCYSADGAAGAGASNLFLGESGAEAIVGYVDDGGVASLGHRFWVLDPRATVFGTGSTGTSNALFVTDSAPVAPTVPYVAWPPPTFVPSPWVFKDWSIDLPTGVVDAAGAQVSVTGPSGPIAVSGITNLGDGRLKWTTGFDPAASKADRKLDVAITGIVVDGAPAAPITYSVNVFTPAGSTPVTGPDVIGEVSASIRLSSVGRGGKVSVTITGIADGGTVNVKWRALKPKSAACRKAATRASGLADVSGAKARTRAPKCKGSFSLAVSVGRTEVIRKTLTVR